jgi:hypothetical protein
VSDSVSGKSRKPDVVSRASAAHPITYENQVTAVLAEEAVQRSTRRAFLGPRASRPHILELQFPERIPHDLLRARRARSQAGVRQQNLPLDSLFSPGNLVPFVRPSKSNLWDYLTVRAKARTHLWACSVHLHPVLMGSRGSNRWTASEARTYLFVKLCRNSCHIVF